MTWGDPHLIASTNVLDGQGETDPGTITEAQVNNGDASAGIGSTLGSGLAATASTWTDPSTSTNDLFIAWTAFNDSATSLRARTSCSSSTRHSRARCPACRVFARTGPRSRLRKRGVRAWPHRRSLSTRGAEGYVAGDPDPVCSPITGLNINITSWPQCVGGDHSLTANWVNVARAPLVVSAANNVIATAVTTLRTGDSTNSTMINIYDWHLEHAGTGGSGLNPPASLTASQRDTQLVDAATPEDQFEPSFALDPVSGHVFIDWYDTAESSGTNTPTSVHGVVKTTLGGTTAGNQSVFLPSPVYTFGFTDLGGYNGASPFPDSGKFAVGFTDGWQIGATDGGKGGIYTVIVGP
jgi:hypothetical protein